MMESLKPVIKELTGSDLETPNEYSRVLSLLRKEDRGNKALMEKTGVIRRGERYYVVDRIALERFMGNLSYSAVPDGANSIFELPEGVYRLSDLQTLTKSIPGFRYRDITKRARRKDPALDCVTKVEGLGYVVKVPDFLNAIRTELPHIGQARNV